MLNTRLFSYQAFIAKFAVLALSLMFFSPAAIAEGDAGARAFIDDLGQKAITSLVGKDLTPSTRETRVAQLLQNYFDVPTIAKFALGRNWKDATPKQQDEYMRLFQTMIVRTYSQRFEEYQGQVLKINGEMKSGDKDIIVNSQLEKQGGPPVNVDWRVRRKGSGFKIVDVIVEGVSMSITQRSDFAAVIQRGGGNIDTLLASLKERSDAAAKKKG